MTVRFFVILSEVEGSIHFDQNDKCNQNHWRAATQSQKC